MINSCQDTKRINSFQYVAIPSPRDVFNMYGERLSSRGEYSTDSAIQTFPVPVNSSSVIDGLINAQRMLEIEVK